MQSVERVAWFPLSAFSKMWEERDNSREELQNKNELGLDAFEYSQFMQITQDSKIRLIIRKIVLSIKLKGVATQLFARTVDTRDGIIIINIWGGPHPWSNRMTSGDIPWGYIRHIFWECCILRNTARLDRQRQRQDEMKEGWWASKGSTGRTPVHKTTQLQTQATLIGLWQASLMKGSSWENVTMCGWQDRLVGSGDRVLLQVWLQKSK